MRTTVIEIIKRSPKRTVFKMETEGDDLDPDYGLEVDSMAWGWVTMFATRNFTDAHQTVVKGPWIRYGPYHRSREITTTLTVHRNIDKKEIEEWFGILVAYYNQNRNTMELSENGNVLHFYFGGL